MSLSIIINLILFIVAILGTTIKPLRRLGFALLLYSLSRVDGYSIDIILGINARYHILWSALETIISLLIITITVLFTYWFAQKIGIVPSISLKYFEAGKIAAFVGIAVASNFIISAIISSLSKIPYVPANQATLNEVSRTMPYVLYAVPVILAGFFEELTYRVGVFELLFPKHRKIAFAVSAFIFTFIHVSAGSLLDWHAWLIYGSGALILTWAYYKWQNFYINMSIHATYNFIGILLTGLARLVIH